jgi:hypothetical protein
MAIHLLSTNIITVAEFFPAAKRAIDNAHKIADRVSLLIDHSFYAFPKKNARTPNNLFYAKSAM